MTTDLSAENEAFLKACEEEFKDRYTENDTEFMKVFTAEPSVPPIIKDWLPHKRLQGQNNRRYAPYDKEKSHRDRRYQESRATGSHDNRYSRYRGYHPSDYVYNRFH